MDQPASCACGAANKLIFSCSGTADVGAISDQAARQLAARGAGKMFCLAGLGGRVPQIMQTTASAAKVLAIDGCNLDCARLSLEQAGFRNFQHLRLTDMDLEKGTAVMCEERMKLIVLEAEARLA